MVAAWGEYDFEDEQEHVEEETSHLWLMAKTDDEGESSSTKVCPNNIEEELT